MCLSIRAFCQVVEYCSIGNFVSCYVARSETLHYVFSVCISRPVYELGSRKGLSFTTRRSECPFAERPPRGILTNQLFWRLVSRLTDCRNGRNVKVGPSGLIRQVTARCRLSKPFRPVIVLDIVGWLVPSQAHVLGFHIRRQDNGTTILRIRDPRSILGATMSCMKKQRKTQDRKCRPSSKAIPRSPWISTASLRPRSRATSSSRPPAFPRPWP